MSAANWRLFRWLIKILINNLLCSHDHREMVHKMLEEKEELRQKELQFKEQCRQELTRLQQELQ